MQESIQPDVAIVVATLNRHDALRTTLLHLLEQRGCSYHIYIVDQSDEPTANLNLDMVEDLRRLAQCDVSYERVRLKSLPHARNIGVSNTRSHVVLFVDDDVLLTTKGFVKAHLDVYSDELVGGVTGRTIERFLLANASKTRCYISIGGRTIVNLLGRESLPVATCKGCNMSYRRDVFSRVGGFDRQTNMLEDADFSTRVRDDGWKLMFAPDAELVHLSMLSGGVRVASSLATDYVRFKSTAYFVFKHRGIVGRLCFLMTYLLIALVRLRKDSRLEVLTELARAVSSGIKQHIHGPDERLEIVD